MSNRSFAPRSITQCGSTVYIRIDMVFVLSPYIEKFSSYFQFQLLISLQHRTCQNKVNHFTTKVSILIGRTHRLERPSATVMCNNTSLTHS